MGFYANLFSRFTPPPMSPSIRFGDWIFSPPEPVNCNNLPGLGGPESPGLYAIVVFDASWRPLPDRPLYFGESDKIWNRATPSHENYASWKRECGTGTLYRAFTTWPDRPARSARPAKVP